MCHTLIEGCLLLHQLVAGHVGPIYSTVAVKEPRGVTTMPRLRSTEVSVSVWYHYYCW